MAGIATLPGSEHLDTVRVAVYARQSKARPDSSEASPEAQVSAGESLSDSRGWRVVHRFKDVGRSGWDPKAVRPGFEELMKAVRAGEVDVVVVNELSRLTRKGAHDALEIDKEFKKYGVRFVSVLEPFLDTSNPIGVAIFALIAALAKQDSDIKAERLRGAKEEIKAVGGRHSSSAPYGMRAVRERIGNLVVSVLEPDEDNRDHVATVERMIEMSWEGISDNKIATTLEEEGVPAPGTAERRATEKRLASIKKRRVSGEQSPIRWRAQTVRWILNHPAIGGFASERVKRGKAHVNVIARDEAGSPLTPHRGVTDGAKWLELQERRNKRNKTNRQPGGSAEARLLSGWRFMRCDICAGSMGQTKNNGGQDYYSCANPKGHGGLTVKREYADDYVARRVWARLVNADMNNVEDREWVAAAALRFAQQTDSAGVEEERRETAAHLEHVRQSITELQEDRKAGLYRGRDELATWRATMQQYRAYEDQCVARLAELDEKTASAVHIPAEWFTPGEDPLGPESPWALWDVYERRAFLELFLTGLSVGPGRDPETRKYIAIENRVMLDWRPLPSNQDSDEEDEQEEALLTL
ncbi:recombinase family protein [Streptomyces sp. NBC_00078]|uniref:recombinase family protein n=1 Tax=unclassified Streptomyces TaxID=2593676 RepID=UPI00225A8374|nr:recombinase family protein [Streptomyces sp. NBC_00078]MCX5423161.1 recombinase family protein [Streptomyces sp. NBC_00078]